MSFILDALKKSEADRQKQDAPGFSHVPDKSADKTASPWIWIIVVLIVINVAVLSVMFMRPDNGSPTSAAPAQANTTTTPAVTAPAPARPDTPLPDDRNSRPVETRPAPSTANPAPRSEVTPPREAPAAAVALPVAAPVTTDEPVETFATFNDLRAQGVLGISDLHLDIHVFSEQAAERFVFVNMSKYKENETLDEGPLVSKITPEGVILVHRGMMFLLPRE